MESPQKSRELTVITNLLSLSPKASFQLFLGEANFFKIFQCPRTFEKLEETALNM